MLNEHGIKIAPSTFYKARSRRPSKRALRDAEIVALIDAERARQRFVRRFGARNMWLHLRGRGHDVARCTIERLYSQQGWVGALRLKKIHGVVRGNRLEGSAWDWGNPAEVLDAWNDPVCPDNHSPKINADQR